MTDGNVNNGGARHREPAEKVCLTCLRSRSVSLRGSDSKGRSAVGIRGEPEEGSDIKDSLGTGLKIRSQGFVETGRLDATAARHTGRFGHVLKAGS